MPMRRGFLALFIISLFAGMSSAQTTGYNDFATFQAAINPGFYLESFDSLQMGEIGNSLNFSGNGFSYTATPATGNFYNVGPGPDVWVSTFFADTSITFTFSSNNVTAVGANIFVTDVFGELITGNITLHHADGSFVTLTDPAITGFAGFTSSSPISFVSVDGVGGGAFVTVNDFIAGTAAVPEPTTWALMGLSVIAGGGGLWQWRRRQRTLLNASAEAEDVVE